MMTKAKARKLAQVARSRGYLVVDTYTIELYCPLSGRRGRTLHRVAVGRNLAWEPFTAPMIAAAFIEHYRSEYAEARCPYADSAA